MTGEAVSRITALRNAAAKLAEALAVPALDFDIASNLIADASDLFPYDDDAPESRALNVCTEDRMIINNSKGWEYTVRAIRLSMLAEALVLEQNEESTQSAYDWVAARSRLGALVRSELAHVAPERG